MAITLLDDPIVPIANPDDAVATYEALRPYLMEAEFVPTVVHVIEKAGGAPDKAGVKQREDHARRAFDEFRQRAQLDGIEVKTKLLYGTDVAETIHDEATELDASAIVFTSRGGSGWLNLVSGNVRAKLIDKQERPVVVLPNPENDE